MKGGYGSNATSSGRSGSSSSSSASGTSGSTGKTGMSGNTSKYLNIGLAILGIIILLFLIGSYYNHKRTNGTEGFFSKHGQHCQNPVKGNFRPGPETEEPNKVKASEGLGRNEVFSSVPSSEESNVERGGPYNSDEEPQTRHHMKNKQGKHGLHGNQYPADCYPKDTLTAAELLPSDANSKWAQVNPNGQGELGDQNFLEAGFHIGTNTIGQTLRNPNLQLRSEPSNPQVKVSPWMQTTIEPDANRRGLEIGGC